jgi:SAM-dependent methyltransferase
MMNYLKERTNLFSVSLAVLDIAPLRLFHDMFCKMSNLNYSSIDLNLPYVTKKADLTNLPFDNETFDCILCYHVLEHIEDDIRALSEMYRVLKKDGWAIIQSPFDKSLENTIAYKDVNSPEERNKLYGQDDHVRIYGRDFVKRICSAGFVVKEDDFVKKYNDLEITKFGLDRDEIINFCTKQ